MNNPVVFTDFHHAGLLNSLILLFEDRLGGLVYRPIGMDWQKKGYWHIYPHPETAKQYLELNSTPADGTPPLNQVLAGEQIGLYTCQDIVGGGENKAITLDAFFRMPIDLVIASVPQHIEPFKKLCAEHPHHPRLIFQIGNDWCLEAGQARNILSSARLAKVPKGINYVEYHQEFDLNEFCHTPVSGKKRVYSFINCLGNAANHQADWALFLQLEQLLPEFEFRSFGGQCRDGGLTGDREVAEAIKRADFVFHCKTGGDGYGHIIHNAAAVGRPLITRQSDYAGKLAEGLIGDSSVIVDNLSPEQIALQIRSYYNGHKLEKSSVDMRARFLLNVDFDQEEQAIRQFLEQLQ